MIRSMKEGSDRYKRAKERVLKQKRFYRHASSWVFTSIFLMVLFMFLRMPPWITLVVIAGWGVGIAAEAVDVFGLPGMDRDWEERKIKEEMERLDQYEGHTKDYEDEEEEDYLDLNEPPPPATKKKAQPKNWRDSDLV